MIEILWRTTVLGLAVLGGLSVVITFCLLVMAIADDRANRSARRREARRLEQGHLS